MNKWIREKSEYVFLRRRTDEGFSLLELVVTVGLLAILAILGVISYSGIANSAKQSSVDKAVSEVFTNVLVRSSGDEKINGDPLKADEEWMESAGDKNLVTVEVIPLDNKNYKVQAYYDSDSLENSKFTAVKTTFDDDTDNADNPDDPENPGDIIGTDPLLSSFTFVCDETSTGYLPISNIDMETTTILLIANGGTPETVEFTTDLSGKSYFQDTGPSFALKNVSPQIQMDAGVEYKIQVKGTFESLAHIYASGNKISDCIKSVDLLGEDSELRNINQLISPEGENINVSFPDSIPDSVESIAFAFTRLNIDSGSSIERWHTSNINTTFGTFMGTTINSSLDLSTWDMSNVSDASFMFRTTIIQGDLNLSNWTMPGYNSSIIQNITANTIKLDNWKLQDSIIKTSVISVMTNYNISMDNWVIDNTEFKSMILSSNHISSMNNWTITNQHFNVPLFVNTTVENNANGWVIDNITFNAPLMSGNKIKGNMDNWTIQNVNDRHWLFESTGTTINGTRDGWTLDGSPM